MSVSPRQKRMLAVQFIRRRGQRDPVSTPRTGPSGCRPVSLVGSEPSRADVMSTNGRIGELGACATQIHVISGMRCTGREGKDC